MTLYLSLIALLNALAICLFALDKYYAKKNKWRIPESTLLATALFGGGFGAMIASKIFHHKTKKSKFKLALPISCFTSLGIYILCYQLFENSYV